MIFSTGHLSSIFGYKKTRSANAKAGYCNFTSF